MSKDSPILFEKRGVAGFIRLNRQQTLNAVDGAMLRALNDQLDQWEADDSIARIVIGAVAGRAFSAGGDIRHLYEAGTSGSFDFDFFAHEYALNARIAKFPKPYVALVDGIAMGGGVGISFHGSHVVAGENLSFAMPEVGIGFFPDVGASHLLSRLPGHTGVYLGLTGNRIGQQDALWCGLATHACSKERLPVLTAALEEEGDVNAILQAHSDQAGPSELSDLQPQIEEIFRGDSIKAIIETAQSKAATSPFASRCLQKLQEKCPTSLAVALEQISRGAHLDIDACMKMEYRILCRMLPRSDFYEGIRAAIIDKDGKPAWSPASHEEVGTISGFFDELGNKELALQ